MHSLPIYINESLYKYIPCQSDLKGFVASYERSQPRQTLLSRTTYPDQEGVTTRGANYTGHL